MSNVPFFWPASPRPTSLTELVLGCQIRGFSPTPQQLKSTLETAQSLIRLGFYGETGLHPDILSVSDDFDIILPSVTSLSIRHLPPDSLHRILSTFVMPNFSSLTIALDAKDIHQMDGAIVLVDQLHRPEIAARLRTLNIQHLFYECHPTFFRPFDNLTTLGLDFSLGALEQKFWSALADPSTHGPRSLPKRSHLALGDIEVLYSQEIVQLRKEEGQTALQFMRLMLPEQDVAAAASSPQWSAWLCKEVGALSIEGFDSKRRVTAARSGTTTCNAALSSVNLYSAHTCIGSDLGGKVEDYCLIGSDLKELEFGKYCGVEHEVLGFRIGRAQPGIFLLEFAKNSALCLLSSEVADYFIRLRPQLGPEGALEGDYICGESAVDPMCKLTPRFVGFIQEKAAAVPFHYNFIAGHRPRSRWEKYPLGTLLRARKEYNVTDGTGRTRRRKGVSGRKLFKNRRTRLGYAVASTLLVGRPVLTLRMGGYVLAQSPAAMSSEREREKFSSTVKAVFRSPYILHELEVDSQMRGIERRRMDRKVFRALRASPQARCRGSNIGRVSIQAGSAKLRFSFAIILESTCTDHENGRRDAFEKKKIKTRWREDSDMVEKASVLGVLIDIVAREFEQ
ncbi:hypothetical protein DFH09DRAFT_1092989 [Mycena vulgaris]|nr:hypothetical protein DFH09DRAFT_1092989 [Mycena vulgaris]